MSFYLKIKRDDSTKISCAVTKIVILNLIKICTKCVCVFVMIAEFASHHIELFDYLMIDIIIDLAYRKGIDVIVNLVDLKIDLIYSISAEIKRYSKIQFLVKNRIHFYE